MVRWLDCGLQATPDSLAHQGLWPSVFAPVLSLLRNVLLAKKSFCSLERGGCSQPSHSSLRISSAFERSHLYFYSRRGRWLPVVCKLPLNLWLFSASSRRGLRQISRSSKLSFCKEVLFVHRVWRLFAIVIFILADSRTLSRALLVCGLQATPESLASQCLLAAYLLRQGLIPVFSGRLLFLSSVSRVPSKSVSEPDEPCCLSYVRTTTRQPQVWLQPLSLWLDSASRLLRRDPNERVLQVAKSSRRFIPLVL